MFLFVFVVTLFIASKLRRTLSIKKENAEPVLLVDTTQSFCRPDYTALVAFQSRLTGDSSPSDQLLLGAGMIIEVSKLAPELRARGVRDGTSSCNTTPSLFDGLHQVGRFLSQLDISATAAAER